MEWLSYLSGLVPIITLPLKLAWKPFSIVIGLILYILNPLFLIVSYLFSWVQAIASLFSSLEPLYTFVACAAIVGVVSGSSLWLTSYIMTATLGMQDTDEVQSQTSTASSTPLSRPLIKNEDSSSYETDWQLLEKAPQKRRKRTAGLLSQTIHEEDDDSDL